jgi:hypothetical protein
MRILTILSVLVFLSATVFAAETVFVSPVNPKISAKIAKTNNDGQQLFVSYDGGKSFNQATWMSWPENQNRVSGQAVSCQWSAKGLLLIEFDNLTTEEKYHRNNPTDGSSAGVFDPTTKIIYWLLGNLGWQDGTYVDQLDHATQPKWIGPETISYRTGRCHANDFKGEEKKIILAPELLKKSNQDSTYYMVCFMANMLKAEGTNDFTDYYLARIYPADRSDFKKFCDSHRALVPKYYELSWPKGDKKTYCQITFSLTSAKYNELSPKKGSVMFDIELDYKIGESYYHIKLVPIDGEYGNT